MKKLTNINFYTPLLMLLLSIAGLTATKVTAKVDKKLAQQNLIQSAENYVFERLDTKLNSHQNSLTVKATQIDSRIDIPFCPSGIAFDASKESLEQSHITVKAYCAETNWYLYLMVKAFRMQNVVVLSRAVGPGTILNQNNLSVVKMDKNKLRRSTFSDISSIIGARIKKRSRAGQAVDPKQLCFVCKGDNILITASAGDLKIKTSGIAQQDGNIGDTIKVKNSNTKKLVFAQVVNTRQVLVQI